MRRSPATGGDRRPGSFRGAKMRRYAVALFFVVGCLLAAPAQAAEFRFPKTGADAFVINLPPGWTTHEDQYNGLQLLAPGHRSVIYLSLLRDSKYTGKPLRDVALAIGAQPSMKFSSREEASVMSGFGGQTFFGQMTNDKGTPLDVKMVIIPLGQDLWATETQLISKNLNAEQSATLAAAVRGVGLIHGK
jgi:hypothetical protein